MLKPLIILVMLMSISMITSCGESGLNATDAIIVGQIFLNKNPDLNDASECLIQPPDADIERVDGEYIPVIVVTVAQECLHEVIKKVLED